MKTEVTLLYYRGRPIYTGSPERGVTYHGALAISERRERMFGRSTFFASLKSNKDGLALDVLPELLDCSVIWVSGNKLRIRGIELVDATQFAQTWEAKVLTCSK